MTETDLMHEVYRLCDGLGLSCFHSTDARLDHGPGFPDLVIAGLQGLVFAELKAEYGTLDREQTVWRYRLISAGQRHYVWRPSDLASGQIRDTLESL
jgi:hypothetical protein